MVAGAHLVQVQLLLAEVCGESQINIPSKETVVSCALPATGYPATCTSPNPTLEVLAVSHLESMASLTLVVSLAGSSLNPFIEPSRLAISNACSIPSE